MITKAVMAVSTFSKKKRATETEVMLMLLIYTTQNDSRHYTNIKLVLWNILLQGSSITEVQQDKRLVSHMILGLDNHFILLLVLMQACPTMYQSPISGI